MTSVLKGNRFEYIVPVRTWQECLIVQIADAEFAISGQNKAKQEIKGKNCWEHGHYARNCKNDN